MIIDTHAHLDDSQFDQDLPSVIQNAKDFDVQAVIIPGADINDLSKAQSIAQSHENIYFAAGVHPYHHEQYDEAVLRNFLADEKCIAVGECGLDYFRLPENEEEKQDEKQAQQKVFALHVELAKELDMPLIVHIRDANDDSRRILEKVGQGAVRGVLHCYNASEHLLPLADLGFYFGIGGVLTFKNAKNLVQVLPKIPKDKLLLETDAPYLTPHPYRGKRNEPAYTKLVAQKMCEILQEDMQSITELTTANAKSLFKALAK